MWIKKTCQKWVNMHNVFLGSTFIHQTTETNSHSRIGQAHKNVCSITQEPEQLFEVSFFKTGPNYRINK